MPIFFIEIEGQIKEIEPFPNQLLADCRVFFIIKDLCQHTGISLEEGNLVKF